MDVSPVNLADLIDGTARTSKAAPSADFFNLLDQASAPVDPLAAVPAPAPAPIPAPPASTRAPAKSARGSGETHAANTDDDNTKTPAKRADDTSDPNVATPGAATAPTPTANQTNEAAADKAEGGLQTAAAHSAATAAAGEATVVDSLLAATGANPAQGVATAPLPQALLDLLAAAGLAAKDAAAQAVGTTAGGAPASVAIQIAQKGDAIPQTGTSLGVQAALLEALGGSTGTDQSAATPALAGAATPGRPITNLAIASDNANLFSIEGARQVGTGADSSATLAASDLSVGSITLATLLPPGDGPNQPPGSADGAGKDDPTAPAAISDATTAPAASGVAGAPIVNAPLPQQPIAIAHDAASTVAAPAAVEQVALHVAKAAGDGVDRIEIQLTPANLGRVEVRLEVGHDGRVLAAVAADRPDTLNLLQRDARGLERALQDAGLRADTGGLSFSLRDHGGAGYQAPQFGASETARIVETGGLAPSPTIAAPGQATNFRPGGIDIRI